MSDVNIENVILEKVCIGGRFELLVDEATDRRHAQLLSKVHIAFFGDTTSEHFLFFPILLGNRIGENFSSYIRLSSTRRTLMEGL